MREQLDGVVAPNAAGTVRGSTDASVSTGHGTNAHIACVCRARLGGPIAAPTHLAERPMSWP